ncbi:right-handed parallel beta-helix repeat-containing protein [Oscillatoriales cyanobacterium LEGE 11467]|uniref:Right-handed parallel beta-helix repeat-containing protein n=1 Tax=Zarconia navalis LEGE 11467 TaxID=1828826 RepID=A0A928Z6D6_9CYAN|nr:right-handed parallel beta-helix repeat-containing protein [Zarconia navalis]MBE9040267.1 right-handed parallel beta-helix repeat-containing protein [Zarconia navalis LEGE 11467]
MTTILTPEADFFPGTIGDDTVIALGGIDVLVGIEGNDFLSGNADGDLIFGGAGIDILFGGQGDDTVAGEADDDNIAGEAGNDLLFGNAGNDFLVGGDGDDSLFAGQGDDMAMGEAENDLLFGDLGNDTMFGNQGDDTVFGNGGVDVLFGGQGNDTMFGGQGDDFVAGNIGDDSVFGDLGNDIIGGGQGSDTLQGGEGQDLIFGGDGNDRLLGDLGNDTLTGELGGDVFVIISDIGSADIITDYRANEDFLQLGSGLQFENLDIAQGTGFNINDTIISTTEGQLLAVLVGVPATTITVESFNVPTDLPGGGDAGGGSGGDSTAPRLQGAELLVADTPGVIGEITASGATSFNITAVENSTGTAVENAFTIDEMGQLSLTEAGATALDAEGVSFLDVTLNAGADGQDPEAGTIRVYARVSQAIGDAEIGNGTDTSAGEAEDTIRIAPGTYSEALNINNPVKLIGPNVGGPVEGESRGDEAILAGGVAIVGVTDVTIDGLELTGSGINAAGSNLAIQNNVFSAMTETAISARNLETGTIANNTITLETAGAAVDGIVVDAVTGVTLENNTINTPAAGGSGIEIGSSSTSTNVTVTGNTIAGTDGAGIANTDGGITLTDGDFMSLSITDNTVSGYTTEGTGSLLFATGTTIAEATQVTITGNIFGPNSVVSASAGVSTLGLSGNFIAEGTALMGTDVEPSTLFG